MNNNNSTNLSKINTSLFGNNGASNNGASMANSYEDGFNANLQKRAAEMENEGNSSINNGANSVSGGRRRRHVRKTRRTRKTRHTRKTHHRAHKTRRANKKSRKNRKH